MKMKMFTMASGTSEALFEVKVNEFLSELENGEVKHVNTCASAAQGRDGMIAAETTVTIWYEGGTRPALLAAQESSREQLEHIIESAVPEA